MNRARIEYRLQVALHRLGRTGGIGLALLFGAGIFYVSTVHSAREEIAALQRRLEYGGPDGRFGSSTRVPVARTRIDQFAAFFPSLESAPALLRRVYAVAERERLELLQGAYKLDEDTTLPLAHYRVTLPVRGGYPQIRRFIAGVLDEVRVALLESVVFQRERVSDGAIEAKVSFILHFQAAPSASPSLMPAHVAQAAGTAETGD